MIAESARRAFRAFALAVSTLTVIPVHWSGLSARSRRETAGDRSLGDADLAASRWAYPLVGILAGLLLAALSQGLARLHCPSSIAAFLIVAFWAALSGGLHLDGLADSADGLFVAGGVERRLSVLRDPHLGSFGVVSLVLVLLGKYACLASLAGVRRSIATLAAASIGRSLILVAAGFSHYARPEGTGRILVDATRPREAIGAIGLALVLGGALGRRAGVAAAIVALGCCGVLTTLAGKRLRGVTGDILGAAVELGELSVLLVWGIFS